jgi:hypothetical protein
VSTGSVVIHYTGRDSQSPNRRKYTVLNGNFVFNLRNIFQERSPGIKRDLPVLYLSTMVSKKM